MTTGWSTALTEYGDTLQRVASRELQDASRWLEIAWLNNLRPPYLTGDRTLHGVATGQVILWGQSIRVPRPGTAQQGATPAQAYGADLSLANGLLSADVFGDLALVAGVPNLKQALELRLRNDIGCLPYHPKYGNEAGRVRGYKGVENARLLALRFSEESALGDPRVKGVSDGKVGQSGDAILVELTALVDAGETLRLQIEI